MPRPFAVIGCSALFSLALLFYLPEWVVIPVLCAAALGLVLCLLLRKKGSNPTLPAALASIMLSCVLLLVQLAMYYYPARESAGEGLEIQARVTSNAEVKYGRYYYQLQTLRIDGTEKKLRVRLSSAYPLDAQPYDEITYTGTVFLLGEDDPEMTAYYKAKGIWLGSYAESFGEDRYTVTPGRFHVMKPVLQLQRAIARNLNFAYSNDAAGLLRGMLLGDKTGLTWAVQQDFRQTGVSHLFSVSGLHMSLLAWSLLKLLRKLKLPAKASAVLCAAFVVFFMALTGFTASCVHAGVMMLILLAGEMFSRRADSLNSLGFAALVLVIASPLSAGQIGLQLSFGATLGIVLFQRRFAAPFKQRTEFLPKRPRKAANAVIESLCVTAAALVFTVPIQLLSLPNGVSLMTFPANLLLIPLGGPVMILGGISALLPEPLRSGIAFFTEPLCRLMLKICHVLADLPGPVLRGDIQSLAIPLALCLIIAAAALMMRYKGKPIRLRWTALAMVAVMLLGGWLPGLLMSRRTNITRLDTGQGMSYLVSRGRTAALLGCSGDELPAGTAKNALAAMGTGTLELLLLPGGDEGAAEIQRDVQVRRVIDAEGVTEFALWDGTDGIFYKQGEDICCLLRTEREMVVIVYSGRVPEEWKEVTRLGLDP